MPIIKSAAKRMRQNTKRASTNNRYRRVMRQSIKEFDAQVAAKSKKEATTSLAEAQKAIDKAVKRGILHKNTAARRKSRLARTFTATFGEMKPAAKKAPAKKTTAKKPAAKKTTAKKPAAKKATKKPAAKKAPAKKSTTKKSS